MERAGNVIHDFIVAAANDSSEAAAKDSRFAEIFLGSALPNQDPDAFPSCTVVIEQFDRLERHHERGTKRSTRKGDNVRAKEIGLEIKELQREKEKIKEWANV